eukprot:CAMPEP_0174259998 /NCGR_PEP_ID=MMETSP0439-20130205/8750_1 /TAXON_ID=0 /ORGANISM="Stereomyxa ramosa, Strain Chinc5" /LENGTH=234 /DNA_ID=CAMNT_0015344107 /DNA_START=6 /DNA_END=710 /DNA_ORIENTATION=-
MGYWSLVVGSFVVVELVWVVCGSELYLLDLFNDLEISENDIGSGFELGAYDEGGSVPSIVEGEGVVTISGVATNKHLQSKDKFDPSLTTLIWRIGERPIGTGNGITVGWLESGQSYIDGNSVYIGVEITDQNIVLDIHPRGAAIEDYRVFNLTASDEPKLPTLFQKFCVSLTLGAELWRLQVTKMGEFNLLAEGALSLVTLLNDLGTPSQLSPAALIFGADVTATIDGVSVTYN